VNSAAVFYYLPTSNPRGELDYPKHMKTMQQEKLLTLNSKGGKQRLIIYYNIAEKDKSKFFKFTVTPPNRCSVGDLSIKLSDDSDLKLSNELNTNHIEYQTFSTLLVSESMKVALRELRNRIGIHKWAVAMSAQTIKRGWIYCKS